jgi:alpha-D-ribose 1-methylphosphonate 5-triphosphate synthase subunit PhnL
MNVFKELDQEWVELIMEAKTLGVEKNTIIGIFHAAEVGSHGIDNYKFNIKWSIYS